MNRLKHYLICLVALMLITGCDLPGEISGTVTYNGRGVSGVQVLVTSGRDRVSATTDAAGRYSVSKLNGGAYTVTPTKKGLTFTPESTSVTIESVDASSSSTEEATTDQVASNSDRYKMKGIDFVATVDVTEGTDKTKKLFSYDSNDSIPDALGWDQTPSRYLFHYNPDGTVNMVLRDVSVDESIDAVDYYFYNEYGLLDRIERDEDNDHAVDAVFAYEYDEIELAASNLTAKVAEIEAANSLSALDTATRDAAANVESALIPLQDEIENAIPPLSSPVASALTAVSEQVDLTRLKAISTADSSTAVAADALLTIDPEQRKTGAELAQKDVAAAMLFAEEARAAATAAAAQLVTAKNLVLEHNSSLESGAVEAEKVAADLAAAAVALAADATADAADLAAANAAAEAAAVAADLAASSAAEGKITLTSAADEAVTAADLEADAAEAVVAAAQILATLADEVQQASDALDISVAEKQATDTVQKKDLAGGAEKQSFYTYDDTTGNLLIEAIDIDGDGTEDSLTTYTYNENGEILLVEYNDDNDTLIDAASYYTYDESGRVLQANRDDNNDGSTEAAYLFSYDTNGNITQVDRDDLSDGTLDASNTYGYDEEGKLMVITQNSSYRKIISNSVGFFNIELF